MAEKLRFQYDTADEVPETHRDLYEERDGKFIFTAVEGIAEDKKRLSDFRTSTLKLTKDLDQLKKQYEGIDVDDVKAMRAKLAEWEEKDEELKTKKLLEEKDIEELRKQWTQKIAKERDTGFAERDAKVTALTTRLNTLLITDELRRIGVKKKLNDWSVEDLVSIGSQVAGLTDKSEVVVYEMRNGERSIRLNDNGEPMTLDEWADEQIAARPGWLPTSSGGGAHHQAAAGHNGTTAKASQKPVAQWTKQEKAAYIGKNGLNAWEQLLTAGTVG